ncbi:MAG: hypothetical protein WBL19_00190 [Minisyncoccia bacterium]
MSKALSVLPFIVLAAIFSFPDIYLWATVDNFDSPVRYYRGDTYHYLSVFRSAMIDGGPNANSFFVEQPDEKSQFFILQSLALLLSPFKDVSIVWFDVFLRSLVALLVYWLLTKLFLLQSVSERLSKILAFSATLIYGIIALKGAAIGFWFLPALLGGLYCVMKFLEDGKDGMRSSVWPIFLSLPLFAVHPVYFTMGGLAALLAWFIRLREDRSRRMLAIFFAWCLTAIGLFATLYLSFFIGSPGGEDATYRVVAIDTRLPIHPVFSLQLITIAIVALLAKERAILMFAIAAFVGLNSYIVTGTYIANSHYALIINDFLVILLVLAILFKDKALGTHRVLGVLTFLLFAFMLFEILRYLDFQPGYIGRWALLLSGFFFLSVLLVSTRVRSYITGVLGSKLIWLVVVFALLYAPTIAYKDMQADIDEHREVQSYRPLVEEFKSKEAGAVLARPEVANIVSLYTGQKVYWSNNAFPESVTDEELLERWMDAAIFYPEDEFIYGEEAVTSVMGNSNRCMVHKRDDYYNILVRIGFPQFKEDLCDRYISYRAGWPELVEESRDFSRQATSTGVWQPQYRLDWLIVEESEKEKLGKFLDKYFTFVKVVDERFFVYHFKNGLP